MATEQEKTGFQRRKEEIQEIQKDYSWFYRLLGGFIILLIGTGIGAMIFDEPSRPAPERGYAVNIYTEVISVIVTILILGVLNNRQAERREYERLKNALRSPVAMIAVDAVRLLRQQNEFQKAVDEYNGVLSNVKWEDANLRDVDLVRAKLMSANLAGADLGRANLAGANLREANLTGANLREANLTGANLRGANLTGVNLRGANLIGENLEGANLSLAQLSEANLTAADLREANLTAANLRGANLTVADLRGANLTVADLRGVNLSGADLRGANLSVVKLWGANLNGAQLWGVNFFDAELWQANLSGADLRGANLSGADLRVVEFDSKTLLPDNTQWVTGTDMARFTDLEYDNSQQLKWGDSEVRTHPVSRHDLLRILKQLREKD